MIQKLQNALVSNLRGVPHELQDSLRAAFRSNAAAGLSELRYSEGWRDKEFFGQGAPPFTQLDAVFRGERLRFCHSPTLVASGIPTFHDVPRGESHRRVLLRDPSDNVIGVNKIRSYKEPDSRGLTQTIFSEGFFEWHYTSDLHRVRGTHMRYIFCMTESGQAVVEALGGYAALLKLFEVSSDSAKSFSDIGNFSKITRVPYSGGTLLLKQPKPIAGRSLRSAFLEEEIVPSDFYIDSFGHAAAVAAIGSYVLPEGWEIRAVRSHVAGLSLNPNRLHENSFTLPTFLLMEEGPSITAGDLKMHFEPPPAPRSKLVASSIKEDHEKGQRVAEYVEQNRITYEAFKRLETTIDRIEQVVGAVGYGDSAYAHLHSDFNLDNFLISQFDAGKWRLALVDQMNRHSCPRRELSIVQLAELDWNRLCSYRKLYKLFPQINPALMKDFQLATPDAMCNKKFKDGYDGVVDASMREQIRSGAEGYLERLFQS